MDKPTFPLRVRLRGRQEFPAVFLSWDGPIKGARKSMILVAIEGKAATGKAVFSVCHGYGEDKWKEFRLTEDCQEQLIEWAATLDPPRRISKMPRSTGRKHTPRQPKVHPKQLGLFGSILIGALLSGFVSPLLPVRSGDSWESDDCGKMRRGTRYEELTEEKRGEKTAWASL